ncbi:MAG: ABC transporter ATP-binding protein [Magnetococcales bacterium]|nr:ABC transporter ATP-binding protein [Magnetococcales bacterium]
MIAMVSNDMIQFKHVSLSYQLTKKKTIPVLHDINMTIDPGEVVSIIGPSGCGKTSFLKALAGLTPITEGQILISSSDPDLARKKRSVSFVFQRPVLFPWRTVLQNVLLPAELNNSSRVDDDANYKEKATELLAIMGLESFRNAYPHQLSGGMQSRVALARAYLTSPEVLLMDEPFASLDQISRNRMNLELLRIRDRYRSSIVFVTHSIEEAVFIADRVYLFSHLPATIEQVVEVTLPKDRSHAIRDSSAFIDITRALRQRLENVYQY